MDTLEAIFTRRSIRAYTGEALSEEQLRTILRAGFSAPTAMNKRPWHFVVLRDAQGGTLDLATLLAKGPVVVTFYRGGWCPFCNLELKAYQAVLPRIAAAGASLVAISPEKPDDTVETLRKNELGFPVLSDVGQAVGRAFGVVYAFTDAVRTVYDGFKLDIPAKNGTPTLRPASCCGVNTGESGRTTIAAKVTMARRPTWRLPTPVAPTRQ